MAKRGSRRGVGAPSSDDAEDENADPRRRRPDRRPRLRMRLVYTPRYMVERLMADRRLAFYWTPRKSDMEGGFPLKAQPLGYDRSEAERRCDGDPNVPGDRGLNGALDDWRRGLPPNTGAPVHGTLKWLFHRYESTRAFLRISTRTQKDYRRFLGLIVDTALRDGGKLGDLALTSISARAVDRVYELLSAPTKAAKSASKPRKNKTPPAPTGLEGDPKHRRRLRQANKCIDVASWAWLQVRRLHPAVVPAENPFADVTRDYRTEETKPATRAEAYVLANALADLGHPSLGLVALVGFEWHQRPENVLAGHLQWSHYRPADRPHAVKVVHAKTNELVWLPLEDEEGPLFPEIEEFIGYRKIPRVALPMAATPGLKGKPRPYSFFYARDLVRRARRAAKLPEHVTLAACRHGGMTELGDAEITEQGVMSLSGHRSPKSARLYIKRTEIQRATAARRRRAWVEAEQKQAKSRKMAKIVESK